MNTQQKWLHVTVSVKSHQSRKRKVEVEGMHWILSEVNIKTLYRGQNELIGG
jgi:hypothetical protein